MQECHPSGIVNSSGTILGNLSRFDSFRNNYVGATIVCEKLVARSYTGELMVHRACQLTREHFDLCTKLREKGDHSGIKFEYCSVCFDNKCNNSIRLTSMISLVIFGLIGLKFFL